MSSLRRLGLLVTLLLAPAILIRSVGAASARDEFASCRNVPTELTALVTGPGGFSATIKTTCSFNVSSKRSDCTSRYLDSQGTTTESTTTSTYNSMADVVDELAVNPPLVYVASTAATQVGSRGKTSGGTTNTFDGNRRIIKTLNTSASGESTTTYTAWDAAGRPTQASDVGRGFSNTRAISYDNVARTRTTVVNGGQLKTVETFDANGLQIATETTSVAQSMASKTTVTIAASQSVCK